MELTLDLQNESLEPNLPDSKSFHQWVSIALSKRAIDTEVSIRLVDEDESQSLNKTYRSMDKPTNVLSFPVINIPGMPMQHIGDLVICVDVVLKEAQEQEKTNLAHFAHMTIHGILHLLGYDHLNDEEAEEMESLEIALLKKLDYTNPYEN